MHGRYRGTDGSARRWTACEKRGGEHVCGCPGAPSAARGTTSDIPCICRDGVQQGVTNSPLCLNVALPAVHLRIWREFARWYAQRPGMPCARNARVPSPCVSPQVVEAALDRAISEGADVLITTGAVGYPMWRGSRACRKGSRRQGVGGGGAPHTHPHPDPPLTPGGPGGGGGGVKALGAVFLARDSVARLATSDHVARGGAIQTPAWPASQLTFGSHLFYFIFNRGPCQSKAL
jgi:hypothetical protein